MRRFRPRRPLNERLVYPLLKRLGINVLTNLADGSGKWMVLSSELRAKGIQLDQLQNEAIDTFQDWLSTVQMGTQKLEDSPSCRLKGSEDGWKRWALSLKTWHSLFTTDETPDDLMSKWPEGSYTLTWNERWKKYGRREELNNQIASIAGKSTKCVT
ncbi:hypothetical protein R1flu_001850 [Riccia fluitans]|uniref:Uncharacterized protein n=1 Tax=Riccia fluitans TaxID=41844 RepID=A0ABD1Y4G5_9MARC